MNHFLTKDMISDFIPNPNLRRLYQTSQISRVLLSKTAAFYAVSYINLYKLFKKDYQDLKLGIIGLGHVGTTILQELIRLKPIPLENILISTRSPERHHEYTENGIKVFWDNEKVAKECDFIILACLPHQIETVCADIRLPLNTKSQGIFSFTEEERSPNAIVFSILSGTPQAKLIQMMDNYPYVVRPSLDIDIINITIDQTTEEEVPLDNCLELLHEIIYNSANYQDIVSTFNLAFTGTQEKSSVNKYFLSDDQTHSEVIKKNLVSTGILEE
jgi:NADP oxidoreductase coenzyme F420-dependent